MFSDRLKEAMTEKGISQSGLSRLTGISKGSICQYISGIHEPNDRRKKQIALALGLDENHFQYAEVRDTSKGNNMSARLAARLMGKSLKFVYRGLQDGVFPWGYAVKVGTDWSYYISADMFAKHTGATVPTR